MKMRVQIENESYEVEVGDLTARPIVAVVDGETFEIYPEELETQSAAAGVAEKQKAPQASRPAPAITPSAPPSDCAPPSSPAQTSEKIVAAPIPGVILSVTVKEGEEVEFGQQLCVLEAMKMKNSIRASRAGKIAVVHVSAGNSVRHGQPLMEFVD